MLFSPYHSVISSLVIRFVPCVALIKINGKKHEKILFWLKGIYFYGEIMDVHFCVPNLYMHVTLYARLVFLNDHVDEFFGNSLDVT